MSGLFRRHSNILCFFCHTSVSPLPNDVCNFKCATCGCRNRYNTHGEIISDEPAMYDERLNKDSFAKRASPRIDRFPTSYGPGPFCHTCQTNQMLIVNLLSSYLPPPESPDYAHRLEMFAEYKASLHTRYPPVCESCMPGVEDEIRKKDQMARAKALGASLKNSRGKENRRRVPGKGKVREKETEFYWWKVRGGLWFTTSVISLVFNATATVGHRPFYLLGSIQPILPLVVLVTILWTVWDPTYAAFRRAQKQGRDVRVKGKREYIVLQMIVWSTRLLTSVLFWLWWYSPKNNYFELYDSSSQLARIYFSTVTTIELTAQGLSFYCLRLKQPPTVRLIDTRTHLFTPSRSSTPHSSGSLTTLRDTQVSSQASTSICSTPVEPDLSALSLSSKPIMAHKKPVFGLPSLLSNPPTQPEDQQGHGDNSNDIGPDNGDVDDENAMDWTPTDPRIAARRKRKIGGQMRDDVYLRPPKFFAPEQPTGLESLFARTRIDDDVMMVDGQEDFGTGNSLLTKVRRCFKRWWLICATVIVPVLVAVLVRRAWNLDVNVNVTSLQKEEVVIKSPSPSPSAFSLNYHVEEVEFA